MSGRRSATFFRSTALAALVTLAAAGCGGSDSATGTTTLDSAVDSILDASSIPVGSLPAVTEAPPVADTTAAPVEDGAPSIEGAVLWSDDTSSLEVSPQWNEMGSTGTSATWSLNYPDAPEANVNVVSSSVGELTTQGFIDASIGSLQALGDITIVDSGVRTGPNENEYGFIESQGELASTPGVQLHLYATISVKDGTATVATLNCEQGSYAAIIEEVRPYLETVKTI